MGTLHLEQGFQSSHLVLGLILTIMNLLMWFCRKCWHPLYGHRAFIWNDASSAFEPVPRAEQALQNTAWRAAGVANLPWAAGSGFGAASSCLLLLTSVGPFLYFQGFLGESPGYGNAC